MKKIKHIGVIAVLLVSINAFAQENASSKISGLYKTEDDYVANKLTYEQDCNSKQGKINADRVFQPATILIKGNEANQVVSKKDFFGYVDCNKKAYRFYGNEAYEILDSKGFYIYEHTIIKMVKGYERVTEYCFSKNGTDAMQLLTIKNLENTFASNTRFRYALESTFHSDKDLIAYDQYSQCYKIKYLFDQTTSANK
jgi:hypothetical protein